MLSRLPGRLCLLGRLVQVDRFGTEPLGRFGEILGKLPGGGLKLLLTRLLRLTAGCRRLRHLAELFPKLLLLLSKLLGPLAKLAGLRTAVLIELKCGLLSAVGGLVGGGLCLPELTGHCLPCGFIRLPCEVGRLSRGR